MKMNIKPLDRMSIQEFADKHGLTMEVNERTTDFWPKGRWYAKFNNVELKDGSCLVSCYGNGPTIEEAIDAYCQQISEQYVVIDAHKETRKEIYRVPLLHYERETQ